MITDEDVAKIRGLIKRAALSWERYNNTRGTFKDNSTYWYNRAEKLAKQFCSDVELDCGVGLYPTFEFTYKGEKYVEYTPENFAKRINGFWDWTKESKVP